MTGGFHAGYNYQFAPIWVAGIEGDWSRAHASGSFTQTQSVFGTGAPIAGPHEFNFGLDVVATCSPRLSRDPQPPGLWCGWRGMEQVRLRCEQQRRRWLPLLYKRGAPMSEMDHSRHFERAQATYASRLNVLQNSGVFQTGLVAKVFAGPYAALPLRALRYRHYA